MENYADLPVKATVRIEAKLGMGDLTAFCLSAIPGVIR
jgi:hypothetical protein